MIKHNIMKKVFIIWVLLLSISLQAQDILWEKTVGGKHAEYLFDAIPTPDYGFILVGSSLSTQSGDVEKKTNGDFDYFISKLDEKGNTEWVQTLGGDGVDMLHSINRTFDGGYIVAGTSRSGLSGDKISASMGQDDLWLLKMDMKGNIQWQKTLGGLADEKVAVVLPSLEGGYIIAGSSASDTYIPVLKEGEATDANLITKTDKNRGNLDYWVLKLDASGTVLWQKTIGGKYVDQLRTVVELEDQSIVVGGISNSPMGADKEAEAKGANDWWLVKMDENGVSQWQKSFGGDGDDQLFAMVTTHDGTMMLGGYFSELKGKTTTSDFVVLNINTTGNIVWQKSFDNSTKDILTDIVQNRDGTFLLSGYSAKGNEAKAEDGEEDFVAIKLDLEGNETWRQTVGGKQKEVLSRTIETRDGGYVLMGSSMPMNSTGNNDANFYIVKLLDKEKPVKDKLLIEALPNPTVEYTAIVIGYEYEKGTCTVVDVGGRVLQSFAIETNRTIPIQLKSYPDGVYIINIKTDKGDAGIKVLKTSN